MYLYYYLLFICNNIYSSYYIKYFSHILYQYLFILYTYIILILLLYLFILLYYYIYFLYTCYYSIPCADIAVVFCPGCLPHSRPATCHPVCIVRRLFIPWRAPGPVPATRPRTLPHTTPLVALPVPHAHGPARALYPRALFHPAQHARYCGAFPAWRARISRPRPVYPDFAFLIVTPASRDILPHWLVGFPFVLICPYCLPTTCNTTPAILPLFIVIYCHRRVPNLFRYIMVRRYRLYPMSLSGRHVDRS